jgi:hypothetical protein
MRRDPLIDLLRRRTWAGWIDVIVLFIVGVILSIISGTAHVGNWTTNDNGFVTQHSGLSVNLNGGPFFPWVGLALLYYFIAELQTGQTIGKRTMGLKVITVDGRPAGWRATGAPAYPRPNRRRTAVLLPRRLDRYARTAPAATATRRPPRRHNGGACLPPLKTCTAHGTSIAPGSAERARGVPPVYVDTRALEQTPASPLSRLTGETTASVHAGGEAAISDESPSSGKAVALPTDATNRGSLAKGACSSSLAAAASTRSLAAMVQASDA